MKNKVNYTDLSATELNTMLKDEKMSYSRLKINHAVSPIENPMVIKEARKSIARIATEITKRNIAEKQTNN